LADSDLTAMVTWAKEQTCADFTFDHALANRRLAQGVILVVAGRDVESTVESLLHTMNLAVKGAGTRRTIVATGPESAQSKASREREKADSERERIVSNLEAEITKKDDFHYTITRKAVEATLGSLLSLSHSLRIAPDVRNGKTIGYRLSAMKPGSLLAHVGFANGDLIQAVNGNDITTPEKALATYSRLRSTSIVRAAVLREGKPIAIEIKIE
jgi:general secretion pathway protein C